MPAERTPATPQGAWDPRALHQLLNGLEELSSCTSTTLSRTRQLGEHLLKMQELAESAAEDGLPEAARAEACEEIQRMAEAYDVEASQPSFDGIAMTAGGRYAVDLGSALPELPSQLGLQMPNLRARGENSLDLFEHVDTMFASVGSGGRVQAAFSSEPKSLGEDGSTADLEAPEPLAPGRYEVELLYLALDGSHVQLSLFAEGQHEPLVVMPKVSLAPDAGAQEVDVGVGISLIIDRIAPSTEVEIESRTRQLLEWEHDVGERLQSMEGWLYRTVQHRDFELYAAFLDGPIDTIRSAIEALEDLEAEIEAAQDKVAEALEPAPAPAPASHPEVAPPSFEESFRPQGAGWDLFETPIAATLLRTEAQVRTSVGCFYLDHLHATAGTPELLSRALEKALAELENDEIEAFAHRVNRVRQVLQFEHGPSNLLAQLLRALVGASSAARRNEREAAEAHLIPLLQACRNVRPLTASGGLGQPYAA